MKQTKRNTAAYPSGSVLVVDDEANNRLLLSDPLSALGHTVVEAESGPQALAKIADHPPDVILLDVMMPSMDGFEVCRRLKGDPKTAHIPVLLVTALTERIERLQGIDAGANDFLSKPIDLPDVMLRVRNAIQTKRLFDQVQASCERLKELETVRDRLTQMIIRDVRAPMTNVISFLMPIKNDASNKLNDKEAALINQAVDTVADLVDKLSTLLNVGNAEAPKTRHA
jgi:two-component system, sensor histidine kinase and response regulator